MKKSMFLLLLLLIGCAPLVTEASTLTATPPPNATITSTPTMTPKPTNTAKPTATQPPYRLGANNEVEIFLNGKYVYLMPPDGAWGPANRISVVLRTDKNGETVPFVQLTLENGFVDVDGDNLINIATLNKKSDNWAMIPFSFARTSESVDDYSPRNYYISSSQELTEERPIGFFGVHSMLLGVSVDPNDRETPIEVLVRYGSRIIRVAMNELLVEDRSVPGRMLWLNPIDAELAEIVELVEVSQKIDPLKPGDSLSSLAWFFPTVSANLNDCKDRTSGGGATGIPEFVVWCQSEVAKGKMRHILTRGDVESAILFSDSSFKVGSNVLDNPNQVWDIIELTTVDSGWIVYGIWHG